MEKEIIFVDGLYPKEPNVEWISASFGINVEKFVEFLNNNKSRGSNGYLNIDIKKAQKTGKMYASLNTYKPKEVKSVEQSPDRDNDDLPF